MSKRMDWWRPEYLNARGTPLCAVLKPAEVITIDTGEMTDMELQEAFIEADWPWTPAESWVEDE